MYITSAHNTKFLLLFFPNYFVFLFSFASLCLSNWHWQKLYNTRLHSIHFLFRTHTRTRPTIRHNEVQWDTRHYSGLLRQEPHPAQLWWVQLDSRAPTETGTIQNHFLEKTQLRSHQAQLFAVDMVQEHEHPRHQHHERAIPPRGRSGLLPSSDFFNLVLWVTGIGADLQ